MLRFLLIALMFTMMTMNVYGIVCACGCCNPTLSNGCVISMGSTPCNSTTCAATCQSTCSSACSGSIGATVCAGSINSQTTSNGLCAASSSPSSSGGSSTSRNSTATYHCSASKYIPIISIFSLATFYIF